MEGRGAFGIYLHWPFCQSKCPYCDFNSHVAARIDQGAWATAFETEIARLADETPGRLVSSVYFGGGTPSLMAAETVDRIISALRSAWPFRNDIEITLEANPSSVEAARFVGYRAAGVNRVSMGFQALDDHSLRALGRLHDVGTALKALETARTVFDRVSFDLIYARQNQTRAGWERELRRALDLGPRHLSLYQLTVEEGTVFARRLEAGGLRGLPDEDLAVDLFEMTQQMCKEAGLPSYEVSNHAAPGEESLHNLTYWRGGDYLGIGPGAHGRLTLGGRRYATLCPPQPQEWLKRVSGGGVGEETREELSSAEWAEELVLMGMRTNEGLDLVSLSARTGRAVSASGLAELGGLGLVEGDDARIRTTPAGRLVLNAVIRKLVEALE